jgi:hypothetical protein
MPPRTTGPENAGPPRHSPGLSDGLRLELTTSDFPLLVSPFRFRLPAPYPAALLEALPSGAFRLYRSHHSPKRAQKEWPAEGAPKSGELDVGRGASCLRRLGPLPRHL